MAAAGLQCRRVSPLSPMACAPPGASVCGAHLPCPGSEGKLRRPAAMAWARHCGTVGPAPEHCVGANQQHGLRFEVHGLRPSNTTPGTAPGGVAAGSTTARRWAHRPTPNTASIRWRRAGRACAAAVIASAGAGRWTLYEVVAASDRVCVHALPARAASPTGVVRIELSLARRALPDRGSSVMHSGSGFGVLTGWHCMSWPCRLLVHDRCGG